MKIGDIFYFVGVETGRITKHKVKDIYPDHKGGNGIVRFSNLPYETEVNSVFINPAPKDYFKSNTKFHGTIVFYLVFTKAEVAQRALIDYVLPRKIEAEAEFCEFKKEEFTKAVEGINMVEIELKNQKEKFNEKCNALKKKVV